VQEGTAVVGLYEEVFDRTKLGRGTTLLDVGCGAGRACMIATQRGASVTGLDATPELLAIARQRVPNAAFQLADMEALPFPDDGFDVVTGFNSFQFAADPVRALLEARRVARPGGQIVIAVWGLPEETEARGLLKAMADLLPPPPPGAPGPFALSEPDSLAAFVRQAELEPLRAGAVPCVWEYPDLKTALRGNLSTGPAVRASQIAGEARVREVVGEALAPFEQADGTYRLLNTFRYLIARA
jgi:SAM-dependent methyltransferase